MTTQKLCDQCKTEVKQFDAECSNCGGTSFFFINNGIPTSVETETYRSKEPVEFNASKNQKSDDKSDSSYSPSETTLADLVRAQNRTTHAVRAFVRFLFIQLSAATVTIIFWNISLQLSDSDECTEYGNCGSSAIWLVAAGVTWLVGLVWSSAAGWEELHKSDL
jgi:hypothetical protein